MKRSTWDIDAEILTEALTPTGKTRIMYRCNLSWKQLTTYLAKLIQSELLEPHNPHNTFQTTTKGKNWLNLYNQLRNY